MKRLVASILLVSFLCPATSFAEAADEPMVAPMSQGEAAPFPGVLFNKPAAAKVTVEYKHDSTDCQVEIDKAVGDVIAKKNREISDLTATCNREKAEENARITTLESTLELKQNEIDSLTKQVEAAPKRTTWFGLGFLGGVVFTIATAFAIGQVVN